MGLWTPVGRIRDLHKSLVCPGLALSLAVDVFRWIWRTLLYCLNHLSCNLFAKTFRLVVLLFVLLHPLTRLISCPSLAVCFVCIRRQETSIRIVLCREEKTKRTERTKKKKERRQRTENKQLFITCSKRRLATAQRRRPLWQADWQDNWRDELLSGQENNSFGCSTRRSIGSSLVCLPVGRPATAIDGQCRSVSVSSAGKQRPAAPRRGQLLDLEDDHKQILELRSATFDGHRQVAFINLSH